MRDGGDGCSTKAGRGEGSGTDGRRPAAALAESRSHSGLESVSSRSKRHERRVASLMALSASVQCSHDRAALSIQQAAGPFFEPLGRPLAAPIVRCVPDSVTAQRQWAATRNALIDTTLTRVQWRWMSRRGEEARTNQRTGGFWSD